MGLVRLDKLLASQGTASRSDVKKLIYKGQVTVNDAVVKSPNAKVNTDSDVVRLNGEVAGAEKLVYYMMNKPSGVICATQDKHEKTVIDILPAQYKRKGLFPVGRLDKDTEGLLLITNDGDFAHRVTSPGKEVYKTYYALIDSPINNDDIEAFKNGIVFKDGTRCKQAFLSKVPENENAVYVKVCEGMFHQVKKMLAVREKRVKYLKRISIGGLKLPGNLDKGSLISLNKLEINNIIFGKTH